MEQLAHGRARQEILLKDVLNIFLLFCLPCIVVYLRNNNQQDALFYSQFISIIKLYMFRAY
jgi:hypothetical protein